MTIRVPPGGEDVFAGKEQPVPEAPSLKTSEEASEKLKASGGDSSNKLTSKKRKTYVILGVVVLLAVVALLAALIPGWIRDGSNSDAVSPMYAGTADTPSPAPAAKQAFFESTEGPFSVKLPLFSSNVIQPYLSIDDARSDVVQLVRFSVNQAILEGMKFDASGYFVGESVPEGDMSQEDSAGSEGDMSKEDSASGTGDASFEGVDDFDTYQHEAGVTKSDFVKSTGDLVFAAVEDHLHVWNLQGELLSTITLPPLNISSGQNGGIYDPPIVNDGDVPEGDNTTKDEAGLDTTTAKVSGDSMWYNPKPYFHGLLLNEDGSRLTAIVGGYGMELVAAEDNLPVTYDYLATRVIVYDIQGGTLTQVSQTDINGSHRNSYSVGNDVHIVTQSGLNTYSYILEPLSRWNPAFANMTVDEYKAAATALAEELIPKFVQKILDLYTVDGAIVLSRLAVFASSISENSEDDLSIFGSGIANAITEIVSFDMATPTTSNNDFGFSRSATMQPGSWGYVYATSDWIWVADQGWNWVEAEDTYVQETFLLGFRLNDGATSSFSAVGTVPGSILNQFAIDFVAENGAEFIRVATTLNFNWGWWGRPMPADSVAQVTGESRTKNQVFILQVPSDDGTPEDNELIKRGSVELGKVNETITAVRFFDNLSYVVTFERTDPLYVLDLSNPDSPVVLGELEIPGFSEFMHPITDDNTKLITIGQAADDQGNILGFQISLFDSSDPTAPKLIDRFLVEEQKEGWSGSSASWDERAFRYVKVGDLGRLIVPVSIYSWAVDESGNQVDESFEGFMMFGVDLSKSEDIITLELQIDHTQKQPQQGDLINGCYCYSWLPERSMVFDGNLMTMKAQSVISTNLVSKEMQWNLTFADRFDCCVGYYIK